MIQYVHNKNFVGDLFLDAIQLHDFEDCHFEECDFTRCIFTGITFIACTFRNCNFNDAKIGHAAFRTVVFDGCQIRDVNFSMADKLIFEIHFTNCVLDLSKFYSLKMKGTTFSECSLLAVDFMNADLTGVLFDKCDLHRAVFVDTIINKADFLTSFNYALDPKHNKVKHAIFSKEGVRGLLAVHEIVVD